MISIKMSTIKKEFKAAKKEMMRGVGGKIIIDDDYRIQTHDDSFQMLIEYVYIDDVTKEPKCGMWTVAL